MGALELDGERRQKVSQQSGCRYSLGDIVFSAPPLLLSVLVPGIPSPEPVVNIEDKTCSFLLE